MNILKSRKALIMLGGLIACVVLYYAQADMKIILTVASATGLLEVLHFLTDIISMKEGLQSGTKRSRR